MAFLPRVPLKCNKPSHAPPICTTGKPSLQYRSASRAAATPTSDSSKLKNVFEFLYLGHLFQGGREPHGGEWSGG